MLEIFLVFYLNLMTAALNLVYKIEFSQALEGVIRDVL